MKLHPDKPYNGLPDILPDESAQNDEKIVHAGGKMHMYCAYCTGGAQNTSPEFEGIKSQVTRLTCLNQIAIQQMRILVGDRTTRKVEGG